MAMELGAVFPDKIGKFRGEVVEKGRAIHGFWIRPGVTEDPRFPGGSSQTFATQVTLNRTDTRTWRVRSIR